MKIKILGNKEKFLKPTKGTERSAAYDLYVQEDVVIKQGRQVIPMGFAIELDPNTAAEIHPRSGFASKGMEGKIFYRTPKDAFERHYMEDNKIINDKIEYLGIVTIHEKEYCEWTYSVPDRFDADVIYGLIDEDYRNEVGVIIRCHSLFDYIIKRGTRIAQMLIVNVPQTEIEYTDELSETERKGGFGHTGA